MYIEKGVSQTSLCLYLMCKKPCHNDIIVAGKNSGNITGFLSLTYLDIIRTQIYCMPTKQIESSLK